MATLIAICMGFISCGEELSDKDYRDKPPVDVVDDDGVPSGTPGNESMFGIYTCIGTNSDIWSSFKELAESNVSFHQGDRSYWENHYFNGYAIWIVDDKTIYWVDEYISFLEPPTPDEKSILLESEQYTFKYQKVVVGRWNEYTANYYLTHYIYKWQNKDRWEGRYAMNGSQIIIHTDETTKWENGREYVAVDYNTLTWQYSDGAIIADGVKYVKVN